MASNRIIVSLVIAGVLAASASTSAFAGDRRGNGAAIAAGIIGAVVVGSLIANSQPTYAAPQQYYQPAPPPQVYYQPQPVQQVYYEPPQQYYQPQPVTYISGGYYDRHQYRRHHHRHGGYYSR